MPSIFQPINPITGKIYRRVEAPAGVTTPIRDDEMAMARTSAGAALVQLPAAAAAVVGVCCGVLDADGASLASPIVVSSPDLLIDGQVRAVIAAAGQVASFVFDGVQFRRVAGPRTLAIGGVVVPLVSDTAAARDASVGGILKTIDATPTRFARYPVADGDARAIRAILTCRSTDGSAAVLGEWEIKSGWKRVAGVLSASYAATITALLTVGAVPGPSVIANGNTDADLIVTGLVATPLTWTISEFAI